MKHTNTTLRSLSLFLREKWHQCMLFLIFFLLVSEGFAQTFYSRIAGSADWNTAGTWSTVSLGGASCGCIPTGASNVIIGVGHTVTIATSTVNLGNLTVNGVLDLGTGGAIGNFTPITSSTGTVRVASNYNFPTSQVGGNWGALVVEYYGASNYTLLNTFGNAGTTYPATRINTTATITMPSGNVTIVRNLNIISGTVNSNTANTLTITDNLIISSGATLNAQGKNIIVNDGVSNGSFISGTLNITTSNVTFQKAVTVNNGGIIQDSDATGSNTFNGAVSVSTGGTLSNTANNETWNFNSTVSNSGTISVIAGSPTFNFAGDITNNGTIILVGGATTFNFTGNITNGAGATFDLARNNTVYNFIGGGTITITANAPMSFGSAFGGGGIDAGTTVTIADGSFPISFSGATVNISGILINNLQSNTLSVWNMLGTGTFINGTNAVFRSAGGGAPSVTNFTCTAPGNLVYYDSANNQTVASTTYHHLTFGNLATKTLGGDITVNGNLFVGGGTTLNTGGYVTTAQGDVTQNGTLSGNPKFILTGGNSNFTSASALTLQELTINKSAPNNTITFSQALTITNSLTLTSGRIVLGGTLNMGAFSVLLPTIPTSNSYIINNGFNFTRDLTLVGGVYYFPVGSMSGFKMIALDIPASIVIMRFDTTPSPIPPANAINTSGGMWTITSADANITFYSPCPNMGLNPTIYRNTSGWNPLTTNNLGNDVSVNSVTGLTSSTFMVYNLLQPPVAKTASSVTSNSFVANWMSVPGADSYDIEVSTTGSFTGTPTQTGITSLFINVSASPNTVYFYRVRAFVTVGSLTSAYSNVKMTSTYIGVGGGNTLDFNTNKRVEIPNDNTLNFTTPSSNFTLEAWIKINSIGTVMRIFSKRNASNQGYGLYVDTSGILRASLNSGTQPANGSVALPVGQWIHVAMNVSGTNISFYVNGMLSSATLASITSVTQPLSIGANFDNTQPFNGQIDEVRVWDVNVAQSDIRNFMCKKINTTHPNFADLVVYMPFDEGGTGIFTENEAPNATFDGTLINTPTRTLSTAPIGDLSANSYVGASITINDTTPFVDAFTLSNTTGAPTGYHIYKIEAQPNVTLPPTNYLGVYNNLYYGVFFVGGTNPRGNISYNYNTNPNIANGNALRFARRNDASAPAWLAYGGIINRQAKTVNRMRATAGEYILATRNAVMSNARNAGTGLALNSTQFGQIARPVKDDFTIEFWVRPNATGAGSTWRDSHRIISANSVVNNRDFGVGLLSTGALQFGIGSGSSDIAITSPALTMGQWYHVALTRGAAAKSMEMHINGTLVASNYSNSNTLSLDAFSTLNFGVNPFINATIDEIKFWDTVVSGNTIKDWMNLRANSNHPNFNNLVAYYRCDDATGIFAEDLANGQEATLSNASMWTTGTQPLGDGASVRLPATTGNGVTYTNYTAAGVSIILPATGPYPNGDLVVTRLDTAPESYPNVPGMSFISSYWVIRNYGTNLTFNNLTEIKFEVPAGNIISGLDNANPNNIKLYKRPDNAVGAGTWNFVQGATGFGSIKFGGPTVIEDLSQFVIGSTSSPLGVSWVNFEGQRTQDQEVICVGILLQKPTIWVLKSKEAKMV